MNIAFPLAAVSLGVGLLSVAATPRVVDYGGITLMITAIGIAVPSIVAAGLSIVAAVLAQRNRADNAAIKEDVALIKTNVAEVKTATDGMKDALVLAQGKVERAAGAQDERDAAAKVDLARLEGEKAGQEAEQAKPLIPASIPGQTELAKPIPKTREVELSPARKAALKAKAEKPKRRAKK